MKYEITVVTGRDGDMVQGHSLGTTTSIAEAFRLLGETIQREMSEGRGIIYTIKDEEGSAWTIVEPT